MACSGERYSDFNIKLSSIVVNEEGYLAKCHELCKKHIELLICDEQTVRIPCNFYFENLALQLTSGIR